MDLMCYVFDHGGETIEWSSNSETKLNSYAMSIRTNSLSICFLYMMEMICR